MFKSYIWTLPTRAFHMIFAILIFICFITDDEDFITIHAIAGYLLLVPFFFRIGWGFFGPKYSKFKDFPLSFKKLKEFILSTFDKKNSYIGHNPPASFVMLTMIIIIPIIVFTGALTFGAEESRGIFSALSENDFLKDIHEFFGNFMLFLIFIHLAGVVFDKLLHPEEGTLSSIFKGYKNTKKEESTKLNIFHKIYSTLFLILFIALVIYLIFNNTNPFIN